MKDKYTVEDLFRFMEENRAVKVTSVNGNDYSGKCLAYPDSFSCDAGDIDEPCIEVQDTVLLLHEIEKIESLD